MLRSTRATVRVHVYALLLAVFFSGSARAVDSSLYSLEFGLNELIYKLSRSLVAVEVTRELPSISLPERGQDALCRLVCSGLIIDTAGHILVAAESILDQDRITVRFGDRQVHAELLAIDYHNDIALLGVNQRFGWPVVYSDRHGCAGQMVIAMGNAYGLRVSPSIGFCAGVRDDGSLQFSLPVTSGAIGGGVFDLSGRLLGLITGGIGEQGQVTLAVPAYKISAAVDYLLVRGDHHAGYIGIATHEIEVFPPIEIASSSGLVTAGVNPNQVIGAGVVITSVVPASPAARFGLRKGDLIYGVGDRRIRTAKELAGLIRQCEPEMTVNIEIIRINTPYSIPVAVGRREALHSSRALTDGHRLDAKQQTMDSLASMLDMLREEISRLERRLNSLD